MIAENNRVNLLNTWIDKIDMVKAAERIDHFIGTGSPHQIVTVNLDFLRLSEREPAFQNLINGADLVVADGMPLVWGARLQGNPLPERIAGVDLVCECTRMAAERGHRVFFLGAGPGVAERAAEVLCERYPGLKVAGIHAPPSLSEEDDRVTLDLVRAAAPDILFVAFGAPRQDQWIQKYMRTLGVPVCIGIGGSLDMLSGRVRRAPDWMQRTGLEWLHRFRMEPGRLWKRYFVQDLPVFLHLLLWTVVLGTTAGPTLPQRQTATELVETAGGAIATQVPREAEPVVG